MRGAKFAFLLIVAISFASVPIQGQQSKKSGPNQEASASQGSDLTPEVIEERKKQLESASLSTEDKAKATKLYEQALEQLQLVQKHNTEIAKWEKFKREAPLEIEQSRERLKELEPSYELDVPSTATVEDLNQSLTTSRDQLTNAEEKLEDLKKEPARRDARRTSATELRQTLNTRLAEIEEALKTSPAPGVSEAVADATKTIQQATALATQRELSLLDVEIPAYDATTELIDLQQQLAVRQVARLNAKVEALSHLVARRRNFEALQQTRQALEAAEDARPSLRPIAEENVKLAEMRTGPEGLIAKIDQVNEALEKMDATLNRIQEMKVELDEKLALPGMSAYVSDLLLQVQNNLPRVSDLRREITLRQQELADARFQLADVRSKKSRLDNLSEELAALNQRIDSQAKDRSELIDSGKALLKRQREILQDVESDYSTYFHALNDLNANEQELLETSQKVAALVKEHLMWVRVRDAFGRENFENADKALVWISSPANWRQVGGDAWTAFKRRPLLYLSSLFLFVGLAIGRRRFRRSLKTLGEQAGTSYLVPYRTTLRAMWLTILLTWLWPSLVFGTGWSLYSSLTAAEFTRAVGAGLLFTGVLYVALEFTRRLLGTNGLAEAHFRWTDARLRLVRRNLAWLTLCLCPLVFLWGHVRWEGDPDRIDGLGRLLFAVGMVLLSFFLQRVLRTVPPKSDNAASTERSPLAKGVYWVSVVLPLCIAGLSIAGYHFTAVQLAYRVFATACLGLLMLVLHGLAIRWLWLVRGQLALEKVQQTRKTEKPEPEAATLSEAVKIAEDQIDLPMVNRQTRQLLHITMAVTAVTGIWLIWLDVLPGHQFLQHPLWSSAGPVSSVAANDSTAADLAIGPGVVTVSDLILAVLIVLIAIQIGRNLPGLIEVGSPRIASLDAGARYALSTIIRYVLMAGTFAVAFSIVGIGWSRVQWLVAALSVGVGFGLQELVANFISGVILLFERPVRVGDIITFDGVTGTVTRVQIRATTVRNWDQQDYLIPNKDLITGRVLNWTLSGQLNRIVIKVGVAYESDPRHVREVLLQILKESDKVLDDPAPMVNFEGFGESTLDFAVIAYLPSLDGRIDLMNELRTIIHERLIEEEIEIAFPQRDIRIRQLPIDESAEILTLSRPKT